VGWTHLTPGVTCDVLIASGGAKFDASGLAFS
jgi:hypothetical protein